MDNQLGRYPLGRSEIELTPIGLGCWQFSHNRGFAGKFWPALDRDTTRQIVQVSLDGGVDWFDTAEVYGWGESEAALADALHHLGRTSADVKVATKWWPALRTARSIGATIGERLRRLDGFRIDLYQVHQPFALATVDAQMEAMARLVDDGRVRTVGVSNFSARRMRAAHQALKERGISLASNQVKYSLLDRRIETDGTLEAARELGITIIAYSPLEQGLLTGKFHREPERIKTRTGFRKYLPAFRPRRIQQLADHISRAVRRGDPRRDPGAARRGQRGRHDAAPRRPRAARAGPPVPPLRPHVARLERAASAGSSLGDPDPKSQRARLLSRAPGPGPEVAVTQECTMRTTGSPALPARGCRRESSHAHPTDRLHAGAAAARRRLGRRETSPITRRCTARGAQGGPAADQRQ